LNENIKKSVIAQSLDFLEQHIKEANIELIKKTTYWIFCLINALSHRYLALDIIEPTDTIYKVLKEGNCHNNI